jgi:hypothetical protein
MAGMLARHRPGMVARLRRNPHGYAAEVTTRWYLTAITSANALDRPWHT